MSDNTTPEESELVVIDAFHKNEVLQAASIVNSIFEEYILEHGFVLEKPELLELVQEISEKLGTLYQLINNV